MKLNPKGAKFCPGCPKKELQLKPAPLLQIKTDDAQPETKIVTILSKPQKKASGGLF